MSVARDNGDAARALGKPLLSNPYRAGSQEAAYWEAGWLACDRKLPSRLTSGDRRYLADKQAV